MAGPASPEDGTGDPATQRIESALTDEPVWLAKAGAQIQHMYRYWRGKARDGRLPRRADIDPADIPRLLSHLMIVEVVDDARRYVYRLVGTKEVEMRGRDPTGLSVIDGFLGPSLEDALSMYDGTVRLRTPQYDDKPYVSTNGRWVSDETLFLPLSDDGARINRILVFAATEPYRKPTRRP
ncbi:MAG: PAS domain-containing protein [Rhodospirillaceae bacterium]|nr:PAS domain-containing protein [Rhodospirillaceae bacterium]